MDKREELNEYKKLLLLGGVDKYNWKQFNVTYTSIATARNLMLDQYNDLLYQYITLDVLTRAISDIKVFKSNREFNEYYEFVFDDGDAKKCNALCRDGLIFTRPNPSVIHLVHEMYHSTAVGINQSNNYDEAVTEFLAMMTIHSFDKGDYFVNAIDIFILNLLFQANSLLGNNSPDIIIKDYYNKESFMVNDTFNRLFKESTSKIKTDPFWNKVDDPFQFFTSNMRHLTSLYGDGYEIATKGRKLIMDIVIQPVYQNMKRLCFNKEKVMFREKVIELLYMISAYEQHNDKFNLVKMDMDYFNLDSNNPVLGKKRS